MKKKHKALWVLIPIGALFLLFAVTVLIWLIGGKFNSKTLYKQSIVRDGEEVVVNISLVGANGVGCHRVETKQVGDWLMLTPYGTIGGIFPLQEINWEAPEVRVKDPDQKIKIVEICFMDQNFTFPVD